MELERAIKCRKCNSTQKRLLPEGLTDEELFWHRCELCNQFGLYIQETSRMTLWEFIVEFYKHFKFRYFSGGI